LVVGVTAAVVLVFASNASAYVLEGPYWHGNPPPGTCCGNFTVQKPGGWYGSDEAMFNQAMSVWNNSAALVLFNVTPSSPLKIDDTNDSSAGWDGITYMNYVGNQFTSVTSVLNFSYTYAYSVAKGGSVGAHELGHAIGLGHVPASQCALMNPYTSTRWDTCGIAGPVTDDINGANHLY